MIGKKSATIQLEIWRNSMSRDKNSLGAHGNDSGAGYDLAWKVKSDQRNYIGDVFKATPQQTRPVLTGDDVTETESYIPKPAVRITLRDSNATATCGPEL